MPTCLRWERFMEIVETVVLMPFIVWAIWLLQYRPNEVLDKIKKRGIATIAETTIWVLAAPAMTAGIPTRLTIRQQISLVI